MNTTSSNSQPENKGAISSPARDGQVMTEGLISTAMATPFTLAGAWLLNRYVPLYRGLTPHFKLFTILAVNTAVFFTVTDRAAMRAERQYAIQFSTSKANEVDVNTATPILIPRSDAPSTLAKMFIDNRHYIIGYGWAAVVGGSLLYTWKRRDITLQQKLINARLLSQTMALLGVGIIAAMTANVTAPPTLDPYFERIIKQESVSSGAGKSSVASTKEHS